MALTQGQGH